MRSLRTAFTYQLKCSVGNKRAPSFDEYLAMLDRVWCETYRIMVPSDQVCINFANLGRKPCIPLHRFIIGQMLAARQNGRHYMG